MYLCKLFWWFFSVLGKLYWRIIDVFLAFQHQHCHLVTFVRHIALYQHCSLQEDRRGHEFGIKWYVVPRVAEVEGFWRTQKMPLVLSLAAYLLICNKKCCSCANYQNRKKTHFFTQWKLYQTRTSQQVLISRQNIGMLGPSVFVRVQTFRRTPFS